MSRASVFWVAGPRPGRLGIVPRPRGGDWLDDDVTAWRQAGVDVVVSLLEPSEEDELALEREAAAVKSAGMDFRAFPIPDRGVPPSRETVADFAVGIAAALNEGRSVAVHCRQSIGRSGLVVGAVLVASGVDLPAALGAITASRGVDVPETDGQRRWLDDFAVWLAAKRSARPDSHGTEPRVQPKSLVS